jgi:DNA-binding transcriptional ArsR family regulator
MSTTPNPSSNKHAAGVNTDLYKALSHPMRYRILLVLGEREASPTEIAEVLEEDLHRVCEQIAILKKYDCVELVDIDHAKGGARHTYRSSARPLFDASQWASFPQLSRESESVAILQIAFGDAAAAVADGSFDAHPRRALLQKPVIVDEQGFGELDDSALRHLEEISRVATESAERLVEKGEEGISVKTVTLVHMASQAGDSSGAENP